MASSVSVESAKSDGKKIVALKCKLRIQSAYISIANRSFNGMMDGMLFCLNQESRAKVKPMVISFAKWIESGKFKPYYESTDVQHSTMKGVVAANRNLINWSWDFLLDVNCPLSHDFKEGTITITGKKIAENFAPGDPIITSHSWFNCDCKTLDHDELLAEIAKGRVLTSDLNINYVTSLQIEKRF